MNTITRQQVRIQVTTLCKGNITHEQQWRARHQQLGGSSRVWDLESDYLGSLKWNSYLHGRQLVYAPSYATMWRSVADKYAMAAWGQVHPPTSRSSMLIEMTTLHQDITSADVWQKQNYGNWWDLTTSIIPCKLPMIAHRPPAYRGYRQHAALDRSATKHPFLQNLANGWKSCKMGTQIYRMNLSNIGPKYEQTNIVHFGKQMGSIVAIIHYHFLNLGITYFCIYILWYSNLN